MPVLTVTSKDNDFKAEQVGQRAFMNLTTFHSFRSRNYRLYFIGQSVSLIGTWMQKTAVSWVIYSLTQSKFMLGVSVFATLFPTALFSLLGGVTADRYNRYKILLVTQIVSLVQAVLLTVAVIFFKQHAVWVIIGLSVVLGIINGYDVPARQSLVRELVDRKEDLPNALALNSSMVNLSKLIGPAIAGFILERFGDDVCFGLNAVSFIAVISSLLLMKLPKQTPSKRRDRSLRNELNEAFNYIRQTPVISSVILFAGVMNFFVLPFTTLTPVFAQDVFGGSASTLGMIDGFIGLGAFIGALYLASLKEGADLSRVLATNTLVFGSGLVLFSLTGFYPLALFFIVVAAFGMMSIITVSNTVIQIHTPPELRGRVLSVFILVISGMMPLGSLLIGSVSHYTSAPHTVLAEGIIGLMISALYGRYLRKQRLGKGDKTLLENQPEEVLIKA